MSKLGAATTYFVVVTPGLEQALAEELGELGLPCQVLQGGVMVQGDVALHRVHMHSRIASRVLCRLGEFGASNLGGLASAVRKLPWKRYVWPGQEIVVKATTERSKLKLRGPVEDKVRLAVTDALRGPRVPGRRKRRAAATVRVRIVNDRVTVSLDATGDPMYKRGWRTHVGEAPIRENLAAAMLWLAEWEPGEPLVDPMCGSGTLVIEGATIAAGMAPGANREFAATTWPCFDAAAHKRALLEIPRASGVFLGSDRDARVLQAARSNAKRAGVGALVSFEQRDVKESGCEGVGLVVVNPPYGKRLARGKAASVYARLGTALAERYPGWRVALLLADPAFKRHLRLPLEEVVRFRNGGQLVRLVVGQVPGATEDRP